MDYRPLISPKMQAVSDCLIDSFVGMDHCLTDTGRNIIAEVPKGMCEEVRTRLKQQFPDVALMKKAYPMFEDLHDFILVKPLITESPIRECFGIRVPELEKLLVDHSSDKEFASQTDKSLQKEFQRAFEIYPVNQSRLLRYAGRKGKQDEIRRRVQKVDFQRVETIRTIQDFLRDKPVEKAWIFGSFSRMEERPESDIDILIDLDNSVPMGLLAYSGMIYTLESKIGRKVDLVTSGALKPFATESVNRDKVLIYERAGA